MSRDHFSKKEITSNRVAASSLRFAALINQTHLYILLSHLELYFFSVIWQVYLSTAWRNWYKVVIIDNVTCSQYYTTADEISL